MGGYMSSPKTDTESEDKTAGGLSYGVSSMQGWRTSQEDAHNCCPEFAEDPQTALFAVYDGHGGAEVAEYTAKHFPDFLRNLPAFKEGRMAEALEEAFLAFDAMLVKDEVIEELKEIAQVTEDDEDEYDDEVQNLCDEASMPIEKLMARFKKQAAEKEENKLQSPAIRAKKDMNGGGDAMDEDEECDKVKGALESKFVNGEHSEENNEESGNVNENKSEDRTEEKTEAKSVDKALPDTNGKKMEVAEEGGSSSVPAGGSSAGGSSAGGSSAGGSSAGGSSAGGSSAAGGSSSADGSSAGGSSAAGSSAGGSSQEEAGSSSGRKRSSRRGPIPAEDEDETSMSDDAEEDSDEVDSDDSDVAEFKKQMEEKDSDDSDEEEDDEDDEDDAEEVDEIMTGGEEPGFDSGCTAVVGVKYGNELFVANAGDSRCVLCRAGKAVEMSMDHKPEDEIERRRIEKAGGWVTADGRVKGGLNLSRSLGDHTYKQNEELDAKEQMISAQPEVKSVRLTDRDDFMVIACDGIWNVLTSQEVVTFIYDRLYREKPAEKLSMICEELFTTCLAPNTEGDGTGCDNMTCVVIKFNDLPGSAKSGDKRAIDEAEAEAVVRVHTSAAAPATTTDMDAADSEDSVVEQDTKRQRKNEDTTD